MVTGIKDKVAIIGMGCSRFGERWESGVEQLVNEAFAEAIADAAQAFGQDDDITVVTIALQT